MPKNTAATTVLVTGATSGIGRHAALHLAQRGYRVIATGRKQAELDKLAAEAAGTGTTLSTLRLDVTDAVSITAAVRAVDELTAGRGLDVLVNNAGFGVAAPSELLSDADLRAQFETNVFGLMAVTRAFLPRMRERGGGRVINVSSLGGRFTLPMFGGYNATKYAVESLSDALRVELAPFGVHVVLVEPGAIATAFTERTSAGNAPYRGASVYEPAMARFAQLVAWSDKSAASPRATSRAIERAIRARRPSARYVTPLRDRVGMALLRALPTRLTDFLVGRLTGFSRKRLVTNASLPPASQGDTPADSPSSRAAA